MVITIIFIAVAVAMAVSAVLRRMHRKKQKELYNQQFRPYTSDFSVSEYMGRMEAETVKNMQEAQKRPKYQLVLWAGLDGLRLNDDGTAEWIRRKKNKLEPPLPAQNCINVTPPFVPLMHNLFQQNMCCQDNTATLLALQIQQTQQMVNAYHPPYMQATYPYYQGAVTHCCAMPPCGGRF